MSVYNLPVRLGPVLWGAAAFVITVFYIMSNANTPPRAAMATPAPTIAIDYAAITNAVKAALPVPAPIIAKDQPVSAKTVQVAKPKKKKAKAKTNNVSVSRTVYVLPTYGGCTCML